MPTPSDVLLSRRDLDFLLFEWLKTAELFERPVFSEHSRETVASVLDMCAEIASREFFPHYRQSDIEEPRLTEKGVWVVPEIGTALRAYADAGLSAAVFDTERRRSPAARRSCAAPRCRTSWPRMSRRRATRCSRSRTRDC
jgi:butyryl-CoA dehydrogenase